MATSSNTVFGSVTHGQPKNPTADSPGQGSGDTNAGSHFYLADDIPKNATGQDEHVEGAARRPELYDGESSQSSDDAGGADTFPLHDEKQLQAGLGTGSPSTPFPPATTDTSAVVRGASEEIASRSSQPAPARSVTSPQNRRSDPFTDNQSAGRGSDPRLLVSSDASVREGSLPLQPSEIDLADSTVRNRVREAQRRRSTRDIDSAQASEPPLILVSERNNLIDHLLEHQPEIEEAAASQLPLVFSDGDDVREANAGDTSYGVERAPETRRQGEGDATNGYPRAPAHTHAGDERRHSLTDDILPLFSNVTGRYLYDKINPEHIVPRHSSTRVRAELDEGVSVRRGSNNQSAIGLPTGLIDHVVPVSEPSQVEKHRYIPGSISARLSATLRDAQEERDRYANKAKYTGLALNIAIGLQVLLGSLTTGLSAVAVRGKSSAVATTILGALATLVASYLARSRGSNEPELSITRVKDLEQFIRECKNFEQDHGDDMTLKYQRDVERYRARFENLLGNADGERRLSPTGGALV